MAVLRGRPDEARALLDEALDLSLAARSTPFVTLCLAGYAQLAFADGSRLTQQQAVAVARDQRGTETLPP